MKQNNQVETSTVKPDIEFTANETIYRIIDFDKESSLDQKLETIEKYMVDNPGQDCTEEEKDTLYLNAQNMLKDYKTELRDCQFNFYLNRPQYRFLTDLLIKKMEYDVNQIFIAIELTNLLGTMKYSNFDNDDEILSFSATATEITYIYHLISTHKVKGLSKDAYTFSEVLLRIGDLSKLISYYDTMAKNMVDDITKWAYAMSPVSMDEAIPAQQVEQADQD